MTADSRSDNPIPPISFIWVVLDYHRHPWRYGRYELARGRMADVIRGLRRSCRVRRDPIDDEYRDLDYAHHYTVNPGRNERPIGIKRVLVANYYTTDRERLKRQ